MLLALMLAVQSAGAERAPVELVVPRGACRPILGGKPMTLDALPAGMKTFVDRGVPIQLVLHPEAPHACAEKLLAILRQFPDAKIGFTGNEVAPPPAK